MRVSTLAIVLVFGAHHAVAANLRQIVDWLHPKPKTVNVVIDHEAGVISPTGRIGLSSGDQLHIVVERTIDWCYTYTTAVVKEEPNQKADEEVASLTAPVEWTITHTNAPGYKISIRKRTELADADKCKLPDREFTIDIDNYMWSLSSAGAFARDSLVSPEFYLEPATQKVNGNDVNGFIPRENTGARNRYTRGTAAFFHLYHSDPDALAFWRVNWAPVTIGVGDDKWYFGTGVRFADVLYLTWGTAYGSVSRLPNGVVLGQFTQNANALTSLPTQHRTGHFWAVSLSLLGQGLQRLKSEYQPATPAAAANTNAKQEQPTNESQIDLSPDTGAVGTEITITGTFSKDIGDTKVLFGKTEGEELKAGDDPAKTIKVKVPKGLAPGAVDVTVTSGEKKPATETFTVTQ